MSELLELLSIAHKLTPELRFCQLLMNIGIIKHTVEFDDKGLATPTILDPYNYSDKSIIKLLENYIEKYKKPVEIEESSSEPDIEEEKINWEEIKKTPLIIPATAKERMQSGLLRTMYIYKEDWENMPVYFMMYIYEDRRDFGFDFVPDEYLFKSDGRRGQACYKEGMYLHDVKRQFYIDNKNK